MWHWKPSPHGRRPEVSDTPVTDAFREVVFAQYKEDELTGNGMGNILAALPDIESLERERDEALEGCAKWHGMAIEADKRFVESVLVRDEESKKSRREHDLANEAIATWQKTRDERDEARERVKELIHENENLYHRLESVGDGVFVLCRKLKAENEKLKQQQQ